MIANRTTMRERVRAVLRRALSVIAAKRLQITLSVAAILLSAIHILSGYKIDTIGLVLIFLAAVPWLIPFLRENLRAIELTAVGKVEFLEQKIVSQGSQIELQQIQINRQQEIINQLVVYSMAFYIFERLAGIYHATREGGEYKFVKDGSFERDLRYLRDHGYIHANIQIGNLQGGQNLVGLVHLTDAGNFFVEQREQFQSGAKAIAV